MPITSAQFCSPLSDAELAGFAEEHAGFGALCCSRGRFPLTAMDVTARVQGLIANVEVEQVFRNTLDEAIEATYIFPLPDRGSVTRFEMRVSGRVVEGVLDERERARARYDVAIAGGQRAAIAEEDRASVFTLELGNLGPGEVATLRLTLVVPIPVDSGEASFVFPLVVAPRFIPGRELSDERAGSGIADDTDAVPDASRISPPVLLRDARNPVRLSIEVFVSGAGLSIEAPRSSLHSVLVEPRPGEYAVRLDRGERLDRDFILRWKVENEGIRASALLTPDASGDGATVSLTLVPAASATAARPRDVVFLLDRSGSMHGWKLVAARRAVARMVDTLRGDDRFRVIAFSDGIASSTPVGDGLQPASDRARFRAIEFLTQLEAHGGTEMKQPLGIAMRALADDSSSRERTIVLVTDGQVGNEDEILSEIAPRLGSVRMFTLGIDKAVNAGFLRRLAAAGAGACELVESEDRLDEVMGKVHRRIGTPLVTDLALSGDGIELDYESLGPQRLPALFASAPLVVALRSPAREATGRVVVRGRTPGGMPFEQSVPVTLGASGDAAAALWARAHIRDLEDAYVTRPADKKELERRIIATSLRYRVLSRFTAFVAIDTEVTSFGGNPRRIVQPAEVPAGWLSEGDVQCFGGGGAVIGAPPGAPRGGAAPVPRSPVRLSAPLSPRDPDARTTLFGRVRSDVGQSSRLGEVAYVRAPYEARIRDIAEALARSVEASDVQSFDLGVARLTELVEDLRSLGSFDELAQQLAVIASELREAFTSGLASAGIIVPKLASIGVPSSASPESSAPKSPTRPFWK